MRPFKWLLLTGLCAVALFVVPAADAALPAPPECLTDIYCSTTAAAAAAGYSGPRAVVRFFPGSSVPSRRQELVGRRQSWLG